MTNLFFVQVSGRFIKGIAEHDIDGLDICMTYFFTMPSRYVNKNP
jgi:hypothetical protein